MIDAGKVVSPEACKEMLGHLKACDDKEKDPAVSSGGYGDRAQVRFRGMRRRPTPESVPERSGPVALCADQRQRQDKRWAIDNAGQVLIAKIAKEVYDHFNQKDKK